MLGVTLVLGMSTSWEDRKAAIFKDGITLTERRIEVPIKCHRVRERGVRIRFPITRSRAGAAAPQQIRTLGPMALT